MHSIRIKAAYTINQQNKNQQNTLPRGRIGFSSLDVFDTDGPKYQVRDTYELTNAVL